MAESSVGKNASGHSASRLPPLTAPRITAADSLDTPQFGGDHVQTLALNQRQSRHSLDAISERGELRERPGCGFY